jgi:hypothetical protein
MVYCYEPNVPITLVHCYVPSDFDSDAIFYSVTESPRILYIKARKVPFPAPLRHLSPLKHCHVWQGEGLMEKLGGAITSELLRGYYARLFLLVLATPGFSL